MARNYTRKQIEKIIIERTGGDDPGWLTDDDIKKINGLSKNASIGGVYPAWVYINKTKNNPNFNPNRLAPTLTAEQVQDRVKINTGKTITKKKAQEKADKENATNTTVDFWADSIAMGMPTNMVIAGIVKVGAKPLAKLLQNQTVRNTLAKAVEGGAKIPPQLAKAAKTVADKVSYQTTGRLPRPTRPSNLQGAFNSDMQRIARGMDRVATRLRTPPPSGEPVVQPIPRDAAGRFKPGQPKPPGWQGPARTIFPSGRPAPPGVKPWMTMKDGKLVNVSPLTPKVRYSPGSGPRDTSLPPFVSRTTAPGQPKARARTGAHTVYHPAAGPRGLRKYSPERGPNITRPAMAGALATALFDDLDANQKAVLQEAAERERTNWEPYPEEMDVPQYDALEEIIPSDAPIDETIEEQIAEPGFGRMLGLRRSAEEIERDVAITEALDAGDYDRVATLEKESGPSDWTDSLTQRTSDYTPEQIEAMLSPDVSGSPLDELQGLLGDVEPVNEDSEYMSLMNKGGRVKPKKKKKTKKSSKTSKSYSNKTRKPSRA